MRGKTVRKERRNGGDDGPSTTNRVVDWDSGNWRSEEIK